MGQTDRTVARQWREAQLGFENHAERAFAAADQFSQIPGMGIYQRIQRIAAGTPDHFGITLTNLIRVLLYQAAHAPVYLTFTVFQIAFGGQLRSIQRSQMKHLTGGQG